VVGGGLMSPPDFYRCALWEVLQAINYHNQLETQRAQELFNAIRLQSFWQLQPHVKKNTFRRVTDLVRFPWDKKEVAKLKSEEVKLKSEEVKSLFKRIQDRDKERINN
jgi:hypothetical protein